MEPFDSSRLVWTREPSASLVSPARIEIVTKPHTDLWQRTYYHFRNDTAPVLQMTTGEQYFSFIVKTEFDSKYGLTSAAWRCIWTAKLAESLHRVTLR